VSLQLLGRRTQLCPQEIEAADSQTHFTVLFGCLHIVFLEGGGKKSPPLAACAAPPTAVAALLNTGIHSAAAVFNYDSPQVSEALTICDS